MPSKAEQQFCFELFIKTHVLWSVVFIKVEGVKFPWCFHLVSLTTLERMTIVILGVISRC